jgi:hypothetical protein
MTSTFLTPFSFIVTYILILILFQFLHSLYVNTTSICRHITHINSLKGRISVYVPPSTIEGLITVVIKHLFHVVLWKAP